MIFIVQEWFVCFVFCAPGMCVQASQVALEASASEVAAHAGAPVAIGGASEERKAAPRPKPARAAVRITSNIEGKG